MVLNESNFKEIKKLMQKHEQRIQEVFGPGHNPKEAMDCMQMSKRLMQKEVHALIPMPVFEQLVAAEIFELTWEQIEEMKRVLQIYENQLEAIEKDMAGRPLRDIDAKNKEARTEFDKMVFSIIQYECSEEWMDNLIDALSHLME
jgi:hypothetical protein